MFLELNADKIQYSPEYRPGQWKWIFPNQAVRDVKNLAQSEEVKQTFYDDHLYPWLTKNIIELTSEQQKQPGGTFRDAVDDQVHQMESTESFKECPNCHFNQIKKRARKCPSCKQNLSESKLKAARTQDEEATFFRKPPLMKKESTTT
jgi:hypothetical protein